MRPLDVASAMGHLKLVWLQGVDSKHDENTPLHAACENDHPEVAQLLHNHKEGVNTPDGRRQTALHVAMTNGHLETVRHLLDSHDFHDAMAGRNS